MRLEQVLSFKRSLWRVKTDAERERGNRLGYPMVFWWKEEGAPITKEHQLYLCAANYGMELQYVSALLNNGRMTCNDGDGFGKGTPKKNWILLEGINNSSAILPRWTKCFTCGDALAEIKDGVVTMMDATRPPELVDGLYHPLTREQALDPKSYKFLPQTHPHLFYAAVTVNDDGTPRPFVNGATYLWYKEGKTPVSWLPHVSRSTIAYPVPSTADNAAVCIRL